MSTVHSFPAVGNAAAKIVILGSMPGKASLKAQQYYAHPRNAFWPIMSTLFSIDKQLPYEKRCIELLHHHIAIWDVMKTCTRSSSLDSDIVEQSIETNDFDQFLKECQSLKGIYFNGAKSEQSFMRYVHPNLENQLAHITLARLPSTSPAHASLTLEQKIEFWSQIKNHL